MKPTYLLHAQHCVGESETLGANRSPFLTKMWCRLGWSWLVGSPWCGAFCADKLKSQGLPYPKTAYRAKDWLTYGKRCPFNTLGAIAVKERIGGGHVTFVDAVSADGIFVRCIGGNQGDAVRASWYRASDFITFRIPDGVDQIPAPVIKYGSLAFIDTQIKES
jgi:uncharacterized protein (TIGR02594 family)